MKEQLHKELDSLERRSLLRPVDIVAFAKSKKSSALYKQFEWDDKKASHQHRLWQARELITTYVTVIDTPKEPVTVQAYISLPNDRCRKGGGYRSTKKILQSKTYRKQLIDMALADADRFKEKYIMLNELQAIFDAIGKVKRRQTK